MQKRTVANIIAAESIDMGGTKVKQALPTVRVEQISPFLLLHHFGPTKVEAGIDPLGVGPHPHRGFEPVTFLYQGGLHHKDSRGNEGLLQGGDVQWMTAGMGIIHSEMASKEFLQQGGTMEGIQLWVNLPKQNKMVQPRYQDIKSDAIPTIKEHGSQVRVVVGNYNEIKGPVQTYTPLLALQISLETEGYLEIPIPKNYNAFAYILDGAAKLNENWSYEKETLLHFKNDGEGITLRGIEKSEILLLAGLPIDEPIAQWGPYVMNTQTEILEAMRDYQMGKMGVYIN
ncbi:MAG: pirin family protein [Chitinophagales bacterium]|nr:pirin family protein [Chitinophagales bacterium]